jgi:redox-sensitive bicupin YhaK (pirin superfamily)
MSTTTADTTAVSRGRTVERLVAGQPTSDGAGVKLTRVLTQPLQRRLDPFLMLDAFGSDSADDYIAGFPDHPHRGFETVTYMLAGRMRHGDHKGNVGLLRPGSVQWMTAGRGIVHSEMPEQEDGLMWGFQLWVNLPAKDKLTAPRYQGILDAEIPAVSVADSDSVVRVIAGEYAGRKGPAQTFTPLHVWDLRLKGATKLEVADGFTTLLVARKGTLRVNGVDVDSPATLVQLDRQGTELQLESEAGASALLLSGAPIDEPVVGYGPFVMNTQREIHQAVADFQSGRMGRLA